jgi:hypothetical protein
MLLLDWAIVEILLFLVMKLSRNNNIVKVKFFVQDAIEI